MQKDNIWCPLFNDTSSRYLVETWHISLLLTSVPLIASSLICAFVSGGRASIHSDRAFGEGRSHADEALNHRHQYFYLFWFFISSYVYTYHYLLHCIAIFATHDLIPFLSAVLLMKNEVFICWWLSWVWILLSKTISSLSSPNFSSDSDNTNAALDYYLRKNFYKTASLLGHSCLAAAVLGSATHFMWNSSIAEHKTDSCPRMNLSACARIRHLLDFSIILRWSHWREPEGSLSVRHVSRSGIPIGRWCTGLWRYDITYSSFDLLARCLHRVHGCDLLQLDYIIPRHCTLSPIGSTASIGKAPLADLKSGLATAPTLFAAEEFPELTVLIGRKFEGEGDIELALDLVKRSQG